jgi:hypothetical protein
VATRRPVGGRERTAAAIETLIVNKSLIGWTPVQIERDLKHLVATDPRWKGIKVPVLRTIQRIHKRAQPSYDSEPWAVEDADPSDARVVLDYLADAVEVTTGRVAEITRGEAEWVARLRALGSPLPFPELRRLISTYRDRLERGIDTGDLDAFLAYQPWRSRDDCRRYATLVIRGVVYPVPQWLVQTTPMNELFGFEVVAAFEHSEPRTLTEEPPDPWVFLRSFAIVHSHPRHDPENRGGADSAAYFLAQLEAHRDT